MSHQPSITSYFQGDFYVVDEVHISQTNYFIVDRLTGTPLSGCLQYICHLQPVARHAYVTCELPDGSSTFDEPIYGAYLLCIS
jgi:hypothetical protein